MARSTPLDLYRNCGIMAHIDAGKTTRLSAFFTTPVSPQNRRSARWCCDDGLDGAGARARNYDYLRCNDAFWGDHRVNIIDTPGHVDFTIEVERSLQGS